MGPSRALRDTIAGVPLPDVVDSQPDDVGPERTAERLRPSGGDSRATRRKVIAIQGLVILVGALTLVGTNPVPLAEAPLPSPPVRPPGDYLLMPQTELMSLSISGPAWGFIVETASSEWPAPDFNDQDSQTDTLALAAALVYARTGSAAMRTKARDAIIAATQSFEARPLGRGLGPLRQTAGWVLAADFAKLEGSDDTAFRAFLQRVLTDRIGTHPRWHLVIETHDDSSNNWGGWAGAARIAASLYLGIDVSAAARTVRGFFGDRRYWTNFQGQIDPVSSRIAPWACDASQTGFTPVNGPCSRLGINLDGAIPADISRGSNGLHDPPSETGIMYTQETIAGYMLQVELLYRGGYRDIYQAGSQALRRMADVISRSEAAGGPGWNPGRVQYHIPWLLNRRYGTTYPTVPAQYGRAFGFTDWLYGQ
jgi:hypothetical protein